MKQPNPGWATPSSDAPAKEAARHAYKEEQEAFWAQGPDGTIHMISKHKRRPTPPPPPWPMDFFTAHRLGRIGPREEKAVRLLSGIVSEDELEVYLRIGRLPSEGSEGGRYHLSRTGLDYEIDDMDEPVGGWCIHHTYSDQAARNIPATDDVYARRMLLETNEAQYRKTAIWRPEAVEQPRPLPNQNVMAQAQEFLQNPALLGAFNGFMARGAVAVRHYNAGRMAEGDDVLRALLAPLVNSPLGDTLTSRSLKVSLRMLTILHDLIGGDAGDAIFAVAEAVRVRSVRLQMREGDNAVPVVREPGRTKVGDGPWRYDHEEHWGTVTRARYPIDIQEGPNPPVLHAFPPMGPRYIRPPRIAYRPRPGLVEAEI